MNVPAFAVINQFKPLAWAALDIGMARKSGVMPAERLLR